MNEINDKIIEYLQSVNITAKDCKIHYNIDCGFFITSSALEKETIIKINKGIGKIETT